MGILVLALTTFNVTQVVKLSKSHTEFTTRADQVEATSGDVARQTLTIQRDLDRGELEVAVANARAANTLIDRRVFSWTEFFDRIESTLPARRHADLGAARNRTRRDGGLHGRARAARGGDRDVHRATRGDPCAFTELLPMQEEPTNEGLYRAALRGRYLQSAEQTTRGLNPGGAEDPSLE